MILSRLFAYRPVALAAIAGEYLATLLHHVYGGIVFGTPERLVMAAIFSGVLVLTLALHALAASRTWVRPIVLAVGFLFWGGMLGLYEGGYNHVLASTRDLFGAAPEGYHADLFFQATGWLTFVFGIAAVGAYLRPAAQRATVK